jgi:hypothetical protein
MIPIILIYTFLLVIWFNTEAFVEYSHILKLKWFKIYDYLNAKETDFTLTYHSYLLQKHNSFFTRLITCPFCLLVSRNTYYLCNITNYIFCIQ